MIKHIVMWKLKDSTEDGSKLQNALKIKTSLENLKSIIPEIINMEIGLNINESDMAYDLALYSEFNTLEDLNTYKNHPEHLKVADFVAKVKTGRVVVDYEI